MNAVRASEIALLRALAARGAMQGRVKVTSAALASDLGQSQQAASTALIRLQERGLVERSMAPRGQSVRLTKAGTDILKAEYSAYRRIFEGGDRISLSGRVSSGLGEGAYYLSKKSYEDGLARQLGAKPFRGTLNVKVETSDMESLDALRREAGCEIPGFDEGGRSFGPIKCFRAEIGGLPAIVVVPSRTHHADALELVAMVRLRDALKLDDGSAVTITIALS